jgi:hypothetical protein
MLTAMAAQARPAADQSLVSHALSTELRLAEDSSHPMRYLLRKSTPRLTTTKEICESRDGAVARLVAISDRPLTTSEEQIEKARLDALNTDPSRQRHRKQSEDSDASIIFKLLRMLPSAFVYQDAGPLANSDGRIERFTFHPRPGFNPPDLVSQALTNLNGEIWIDRAAERVTHIEGRLTQDTTYGWGLLGKLSSGGWLSIDQALIDGRAWRITHLRLRMNLRVLFKEKPIDTTEEMTAYHPVPAGIDYREAIRLLRTQPVGH